MQSDTRKSNIILILKDVDRVGSCERGNSPRKARVRASGGALVAILGTQPTTGRGLYKCIQVDTRGGVKFSANRPARYRAAQNASDYFIFRVTTRRGSTVENQRHLTVCSILNHPRINLRKSFFFFFRCFLCKEEDIQLVPWNYSVRLDIQSFRDILYGY